MKAIRKNMVEQTMTKGPRNILYCPKCFNEFSANAGDYFMTPNNYVFKCQKCEVDMELGYKTIEVTYHD